MLYIIILLSLFYNYCNSIQQPNVIIFLVDDMGWMDCSVCGSKFYNTPNIDKLARHGMIFTNAYAANPSCSPTRASILTGLYPARIGITRPVGHLPPLHINTSRYSQTTLTENPLICADSLRYLDPSYFTIGKAFQMEGYHTAHFGKWHLGVSREHWPDNYGYNTTWHGVPDSGYVCTYTDITIFLYMLLIHPCILLYI
jgi:arylsulfatase A-like enzyme